nr:replication protein A 70 kDa DNA-binding subunit B [Tanacetum cinerariifolium]
MILKIINCKLSSYTFQGNRVQATIKGKHISKFQLLLDEGACYRIGNFDVGENSGKWSLLNHKYKLNFFQGTTIIRVGSFVNNPHGFMFEHFTAFTARTFTETELCGPVKEDHNTGGCSDVMYIVSQWRPVAASHVPSSFKRRSSRPVPSLGENGFVAFFIIHISLMASRIKKLSESGIGRRQPQKRETYLKPG